MRRVLLFAVVWVLFLGTNYSSVIAHEAYVLNLTDLQNGLQKKSLLNLFSLLEEKYLFITLAVTVSITLIYILSILGAQTKAAKVFDKVVCCVSGLGFLMLRLVTGVTLLIGALEGKFLGPEITLSQFPMGQWLIYPIILVSIFMIFGLMTRFVAIFCLATFSYVFFFEGSYLLTYLSYLVVFLALLVFEISSWSIDEKLFGKKALKFVPKNDKWAIILIRIGFSLSLIYTAISVKFLHTNLSEQVYHQYSLGQFFGLPASYVVAGAFISEFSIGILILLGLAQRLTLVIFASFATVALLFFREIVWPHAILFGIAFFLFVNPADEWTLDKHLVNLFRKLRGVVGKINK